MYVHIFDTSCWDVQSFQNYSGQDLAHYAQQGDASEVVTVTAVTFIFIDGYDFCAMPVLRNWPPFPPDRYE